MVGRNGACGQPTAEQVSPLKWCSVTLSDVVTHSKRLEASVFDIDAKQARETIANGKYPLTTVCGANGLATAYVCGRFKRLWVKTSDYPIYQPSTIMDMKPSPDGYISGGTRVDIESLRVHKGQVLMTCSGTVGKTAFVSDTLSEKIFSHDLLRLTCKEPTDAGYLYAYFKSKIGQQILLTNQYGAVITHIEPEHLQAVPIPDAPDGIKRRIYDLIKHSYALRDEANDREDDAIDMLVRELRLPPMAQMETELQDASGINAFTVKLSELNHRVDASRHLPIAGAIARRLEEGAKEVVPLGDSRISREIFLPGRFKRVYVDEAHGRALIGGKQLCELDPRSDKYLSIAKHNARIQAELELEENVTLITRSGTIGKVALVPKHWAHWVASEHIIRVAPANTDVAGYISIFLKSDYGHQLIACHTYGSVVDEIDDTHVRSIPFPLLKNDDVQARINSLALQANEKRYQAYCLEQEAMGIINDEVIG